MFVRIVVVMLIIILATQPNVVYATEINGQMEVEEYVVNYLLSGFEDKYIINDYEYIVEKIETSEDLLAGEIFVTYEVVQKAKSVEELAYVQGIEDTIQNRIKEISLRETNGYEAELMYLNSNMYVYF